MPDPDPFLVKSLGRISGTMLSENLLRNGIDLAFDNDLIYLKVSPQTAGFNVNEDGDPNWPSGSAGTGIGIREENPVYDLDISGTTNFPSADVSNQATLDNVIINAAGFISSTVGPVNVVPAGVNPIIFHDKVITANLEINDNYISSFSNSNININPRAINPLSTGRIDLLANTNVTGDVNVTGNIQIDGNLSKQGNIIIGNDIFVADGINDDTVTINTDFTQSIEPGTTGAYDLGRPNRRWAETYFPDISNVDNPVIRSAVIGTQLRIDGTARTIFAIQSNDDVILKPFNGVTDVESIRFDNTFDVVDAYGTFSAFRIDSQIPWPPPSWVYNFIGWTLDAGVQGYRTITGISQGYLTQYPEGSGNFFTATRFELNGNIMSSKGDTYKIFPGNDIGENVEAKIVNLLNTPLTFVENGTGYLKFSGTNGVVIPSGTTFERPSNPELGDTRWNTTRQLLECFDGSVYVVATGGGETVTQDLMTDLGHIYTIMFG